MHIIWIQILRKNCAGRFSTIRGNIPWTISVYNLNRYPQEKLCWTIQCYSVFQANELLFGGRRITAMEAYQLGLVSHVFWPTALMQEVIPRAQHMANCSAKVSSHFYTAFLFPFQFIFLSLWCIESTFHNMLYFSNLGVQDLEMIVVCTSSSN